MRHATQFALIANGSALPWAAVPEWPMAEFLQATSAALRRGGRLSAWFGVPEAGGTRISAVIAFDADNTLAVGRSEPASGRYPALTPAHPQAQHRQQQTRWTLPSAPLEGMGRARRMNPVEPRELTFRTAK